MNIKAILDVDILAIEANDEITLMLDLTAPQNPLHANRDGQAVQIVLDRSGSMSGQPLAAAKSSLLRLVERLAPQDSFGLVAFDDSALVVVPNKKISDHHMPSLQKAIREITPGGSTDISAGYLMGLREINRANASGGSTLLLISDGHANSGEKDPKFFSDVAQKAAVDEVMTSTIGLGVGYDEIILESLSQGGGGAHRFAGSVDEAIGAIAAEVDELLDKSVVNTVLRLTPTEYILGAPWIQILQRLPHWKDNDSYVIQLGDLYSGENRRFIIGLKVPAIASLGLCKIADITIEYLDLAQRQEISVTMPVNINVVPGDVAAGRAADPIVRAERLILEAQTAKSLAVDELRDGKIKEASGRLTGTATALRREASLIPVVDEKSAQSLALINSEAEEIEALAKTVIDEEAAYASKRMTESYSRKTRARKPKDEFYNPQSNLNNNIK